MKFWRVVNAIAGVVNLIEFAVLPGHHWCNLVLGVICIAVSAVSVEDKMRLWVKFLICLFFHRGSSVEGCPKCDLQYWEKNK